MQLIRSILSALFVICIAGCGGGDDGNPVEPQPKPLPLADVAGSWMFTESFAADAETYCGNRGVYVFVGSGSSLAGNVRRVGTCRSSGSRSSNSAQAGLLSISGAGDSIHFRARHSNNTITCEYHGRLSGSPISAAAGTVTCTNGAAGTWQGTREAPVAPTVGQIEWIETGDLSSCAKNVGGQMFCWGVNSYAQLATGDDVGRFLPALTAGGPTFSTVSLSPAGAFSCGLTPDGTAYCWGNANGGRLGTGTQPLAGVEPLPRPVAGGLRFRAIAVGGDHTCAITPDGIAYCWGYNDKGQLGTGGTTRSTAPVAVSGGLAFRSIAAHILSTCGVTTEGTGYCWGDGSSGALGTGATANVLVPTRVAGNLSFTAITMGLWFSCGLTTSSGAYCWGLNNYGQLGIGTMDNTVRSEPQKVSGDFAWRMLDAGVGLGCGVSTSDVAYCWGDNFWGQTGTDTNAGSASPQPVAGSLKFKTVSADWHACGLDVAGLAYCWGPGREGSVGDGTIEDVRRPTRVGR